jgi:hypothetical protein
MEAKELALAVVNGTIELHLENAALKSILNSLYHDRQPINWVPMVQTTLADQSLRETARARYADIVKLILAATDENSAALPLLKIPEKSRP